MWIRVAVAGRVAVNGVGDEKVSFGALGAYEYAIEDCAAPSIERFLCLHAPATQGFSNNRDGCFYGSEAWGRSCHSRLVEAIGVKAPAARFDSAIEVSFFAASGVGTFSKYLKSGGLGAFVRHGGYRRQGVLKPRNAQPTADDRPDFRQSACKRSEPRRQRRYGPSLVRS